MPSKSLSSRQATASERVNAFGHSLLVRRLPFCVHDRIVGTSTSRAASVQYEDSR